MGDGLRILAAPYDGRAAQDLIERVQQEYVVRYGGPDETPVDAADFAPPRGLFLIAYARVDEDAGPGLPVGCGGWRSHGDVAEIKRMYVLPEGRRRGVAVAVLAELEHTAAAAGHVRVELVSGTAQPEALALYARCGYRPVAGFGPYAEMDDSRFLGRDLHPGAAPTTG